jgi:hypothetical protein
VDGAANYDDHVGSIPPTVTGAEITGKSVAPENEPRISRIQRVGKPESAALIIDLPLDVLYFATTAKALHPANIHGENDWHAG